MFERRRRRRGRARRAAIPEARRRASASTPAGARSSPASSTATGTSCSPATARRSSRRGWRAGRTAPGGIKTTVAATRAASDEQLGANLDRLVARGAALRHDDRRDEVRLRADRPRRAPQPRGRARRAPPRRTFLGAHVVAARVRRRRRLRRPRQGRDARRLRAARPLDRRLLRGRRVRRRADPRDPRGRHRQGPDAARARQPARGTARASRSRSSSSAASADHCHPRHRRRRRRAGQQRHRRHAAPRRRVLHPRAPTPTRAGCIDAGVTVALAADCNPGSSYTTNIPFCIAIAVREMHMTPDEAVWAATDGRRAGRCAAPTSATSAPGARADAVLLDAPVAHPPRLPPRRPARHRGVAGTAPLRSATRTLSTRIRVSPDAAGTASPDGLRHEPVQTIPALLGVHPRAAGRGHRRSTDPAPGGVVRASRRPRRPRTRP